MKRLINEQDSKEIFEFIENNKNLIYKFIHNFPEVFNWEEFINFPDLLENTELVGEVSNYLDWKNISSSGNITQQFVEIFQDRLYWFDLYFRRRDSNFKIDFEKFQEKRFIIEAAYGLTSTFEFSTHLELFNDLIWKNALDSFYEFFLSHAEYFDWDYLFNNIIISRNKDFMKIITKYE